MSEKKPVTLKEFLAYNAPEHSQMDAEEGLQVLLLTQAACTLMASDPALSSQKAAGKALDAYHEVYLAFAKARSAVLGTE